MKCSVNIKGSNFLDVSVSYTLGGTNYFYGGTNKRGYYLHLSPTQHETHSYGTSISSTLGSGRKILLLTCERKSDKRYLESLRAAYANMPVIEKALAVVFEEEIKHGDTQYSTMSQFGQKEPCVYHLEDIPRVSAEIKENLLQAILQEESNGK